MSELWQHQGQAIDRAKDLDAFGLLFDAGTGKTRTAIEIYRGKCVEHKRLLKTLILCPQVVINNWRAELLKYSKILSQDIVLLKARATIGMT